MWSKHVAKLKIHLLVMLMANSISYLLYLTQWDDKHKNFVTVNTLKCKSVNLGCIKTQIRSRLSCLLHKMKSVIFSLQPLLIVIFP